MKRIGYHSFRDLVWQLFKLNKAAHKTGFCGDYIIRLPIKWGKGGATYLENESRQTKGKTIKDP